LTITVSTWIRAEAIKKFQDHVKASDWRFKGNPTLSYAKDKYYVTIVSQINSSDTFWTDWERQEKEIIEKNTPKWRKILRRIRSEVLGIWK
jgi:hypothetical protein